MPLTDITCRNATSPVYDEKGGLHLLPKDTRRYWRWRTVYLGKPITVSYGTYPKLSLADARKFHKQAEAMLAAGSDPTKHTWIVPKQQTLADDLRAWYARESKASGRWNGSPDVLRSLERDVIPFIGNAPTSGITPEMLNHVIDAIVKRGAIETAHRVADRLKWFFDYAESAGLIATDPSTKISRTIPKKPKAKSFAALLDIDEARDMLRKVESQIGFPTVTLAHRFHALTAARPGMTETAEWSQIIGLDSSKPVWRIPASNMKGGLDFDLPLSSAAVAVLKAVRPLSHSLQYVFRGEQDRDRPLSNSAMNARLKAAGFQGLHVPHGWRSTFSTIMNDRYPELRHVIEVCLAHSGAAAKGKVSAIYNRGQYLEKRRELMEEWATMLLQDAMPLDTIMNMPKRRIGDWQDRLTEALGSAAQCRTTPYSI